jgi:hypothetical protein
MPSVSLSVVPVLTTQQHQPCLSSWLLTLCTMRPALQILPPGPSLCSHSTILQTSQLKTHQLFLLPFICASYLPPIQTLPRFSVFWGGCWGWNQGFVMSAGTDGILDDQQQTQLSRSSGSPVCTHQGSYGGGQLRPPQSTHQDSLPKGNLLATVPGPHRSAWQWLTEHENWSPALESCPVTLTSQGSCTGSGHTKCLLGQQIHSTVCTKSLSSILLSCRHFGMGDIQGVKTQNGHKCPESDRQVKSTTVAGTSVDPT